MAAMVPEVTTVTEGLHTDTGGGVSDYTKVREILIDFLAGPEPEPRRVFHGRGHRYPGLEHVVVDWYPPVLLLTCYREAGDLEPLLLQVPPADYLGQIKSLVVQRRRRRKIVSEVLWGDPVDSCVVTERGLRYEVRPGVNRNAGLFLDTQPLREWLRTHSGNRNVLNLFAYTCSLSVAALAGDASQVVNVDMSGPSIQWGLRNHLLNGQDLNGVKSCLTISSQVGGESDSWAVMTWLLSTLPHGNGAVSMRRKTIRR